MVRSIRILDNHIEQADSQIRTLEHDIVELKGIHPDVERLRYLQRIYRSNLHDLMRLVALVRGDLVSNAR